MITERWITDGDFSDCAEIRREVFVREQGIPETLEFDALDKISEHYVLYDGAEPVGCARLTDLGNGEFKLGRIAVSESRRKMKLGSRIMGALILRAKEKGARLLHISAQSYAVPFYEKFAFATCSTEYQNPGEPPHIDMQRDLTFDGCLWAGFGDGKNEAVYARRVFGLESTENVSLFVCGMGFTQVYVNGEKVSEDLLAPAWTNYEKRDLSVINMPIYDTLTHRMLYNVYDISQYLVSGENTVVFHVGNGWYGQHESLNEGMHPYGELKLCFKLMQRDNLVASSDDTLRWIPSEVVRTNIYFGETHDARRYPHGIFEAGFDDSGWERVKPLPRPLSLICRQDCPSDKIIKTVKPKLIYEFGDCKIYDLGELLSGYAKIRFEGKSSWSGAVGTVRYADELNPDGSLDFFPSGDFPRMQRDEFTTDGVKKEFFPLFTWHAARYFEVTGPAVADEFCVVHTDMARITEFECSDEVLNWIYSAYMRTQENNVHCCVPSDCPHRERLGYTGDGQLASAAVMTCFDAKGMYKKWMRDVADSQDIFAGHVQHTAPFYGGGGGPGGWGGAICIVPWNYYRFYGDSSVLAEYYPNMLKYIDYMVSHSEGGLVVREEEKGWCLGEWCTPYNKIEIPDDFINTYFLIKCAGIALNACEIIGKNDSQRLSGLIEDSKRAISDKYFDPASGSFCGGIQGADAFALDMGMGDERTLGNLAEKYTALGRFDTGIFGTDVLVRILFENGFASLAFKLLTSRDEEISFYRMMKAGATTLWEDWDGSNSHAHPMFGAVNEYIFRYILGVPDTCFKRASGVSDIRPVYIPQLEYAKGSVLTPYGKIEVCINKGKTEIKIV
ncbi:MAG: GNAT family N-acetyltransferase [Clostridiales bacterium]|nr:GNAT family N-acetyltransferase [Clostridiales bacterium]